MHDLDVDMNALNSGKSNLTKLYSGKRIAGIVM